MKWNSIGIGGEEKMQKLEETVQFALMGRISIKNRIKASTWNIYLSRPLFELGIWD